ncbi:hypothetical protein ACF1BN_13280 [Streptomyces sp. NPDC014861]|uniref:hypothetical protein n=1 Tax=Streptomyces sp. NPDC014861 TaxID=3364923 RepID=UPI003702C46F
MRRSCRSRAPTATGTLTGDRLVGGWEGPEGERPVLRGDGTFCARAFPRGLAHGQPVDSCGRWSFRDDGDTDQGIGLAFARPSYAMIGLLRVSGGNGGRGLHVRRDTDDASDRPAPRRATAR